MCVFVCAIFIGICELTVKHSLRSFRVHTMRFSKNTKHAHLALNIIASQRITRRSANRRKYLDSPLFVIIFQEVRGNRGQSE